MSKNPYSPSLPVFIIIYLFCNIGLITAQFTDQYYLKFGLEDGLPSNNIYSVAQDSRGIIWIGTQAGVVKYDGYEFYTYGSKNGLYQNEVIDLKIDHKDRIWLNTTGPPCYIEKDSVYYLTDLESPNISWHFDMKEDHNGDIWLSTETTIYKLNGDDLTVKYSYHTGFLRGHILGGDQEKFYIYTGRHLLLDNDTQSIDTINTLESLEIGLLDKSNSCVSWPLIYYKEGDALRTVDILTAEKSTVIDNGFDAYTFSIQGDYLIGLTRSGGLDLYKFNKDRTLEFPPLELLDQETLGGVKLDKDGNLWAPTYSLGLLLLKPLSDKILPISENLGIRDVHLESLVFDNEGVLWMGTDNGTIIKSSNGVQESFALPNKIRSTNRVLDLDPIGSEGILITGDSGVYLFKNGQFKQITSIPSKRSSYSEGKILISTYKNIIHSTQQYFSSLERILGTNSLAQDSMISVIEDKRSYANAFGENGDMWIATESDGLLKFQNDQIVMYGEISNVFKSSIKDIISLSNGPTIIASSGEGLFLIKDDNFISIKSEDGLASDVVHCVKSINYKIYVGTNKGLSIIQFDETWDDYSIENLNKSNGLATDEIHDVDCKNDTIYLATHKGILKINDNKKLQKENKQVPNVQIDDIIVNNQTQYNSDQLALDSYDNNLMFKFTAVDVINSDRLGYAYQLSGFDEEWISTKSREVHYSNIPSGKYTFKVATVIENKIHESKSDSVEIIIEEKFIESIWFKLMMACLIFSLFFFAFYLYNTNNQKKTLSQLVSKRTKELDEKMKALEIANQKLEESNDSIRSYAYISSHDLKSPLRNVGSFVQLLAKKNAATFDNKDKEYVKFVTDGVNNMTKTIDDLLAYNTLDKDEPPTEIDIAEVIDLVLADLSLLIREKSAEIILSSDFPKVQGHMTKLKGLFQNLIENGIKYNESLQPEIKISCEKTPTEYKFKIIDNGIGIDPKYADKVFMMFQRLHDRSSYSGTGIGLTMCRKIVNSYGGKIWVDTSKSGGSCFIFTLPV
jgi:signal transduction histidine kinase/ligand-binding sensor domain-containing protein